MARPAATGPRRHARYGIDAPQVPALLAAATVVFIVIGVVAGSIVLVIIGVIFAVQTAIYLHTTLRGKFRVWHRLLDDLALRGDEQVADLGCGRGAVLLAVAKRLDHGTAHGVDVWRSIDQSGNDEATTSANAEAEGVAGRVELHTADLRQLPFPDGTIDAVTSSIAIHNLRSAGDRADAVDEAIRVLAPGGRIVIADIRHTADYAQRLRDAGFAEIGTTGAGPDFWFSGPWQGVKVVTATKPAAGSPSAPDVTAES